MNQSASGTIIIERLHNFSRSNCLLAGVMCLCSYCGGASTSFTSVSRQRSSNVDDESEVRVWTYKSVFL